MKQVAVRKLEKRLHEAYWRKAKSFYAAMKQAEEAGELNAACLNAIHCAISCADAVTTFYLGERSAGQRHEDVVVLLKRAGMPEAQEKAARYGIQRF